MEQNYFDQLNKLLKSHYRAIPSLLVDLDAVDRNMARLQEDLNPNAQFRIVVKSLPSPQLIEHIANGMNSQNYMVFHQPILSELIKVLDDKADILLGKPMPIKTAAYFYDSDHSIKEKFNPYTQIQWLVDTKDRAIEYRNLAESLGQPLRLNVEIDVGLHRGGINNLAQLDSILQWFLTENQWVQFSGFMGYDPHIIKIPSIISSQRKSLAKSNSFYAACKNLVQEKYPELWHDKLTFNGSGSPTFSLHKEQNSTLNDIAAGSCFVKPSTFDLPTLSRYEPACFIASPVLKKMEGTKIPGLEKFKSLMKFVKPKTAQSFFIYGGYWKADYCYPANLSANTLYGESTNQTMVNAPRNMQLAIDDFVFLRPHQSEFVFLQFGKLLILRNQQIVDEWEVFRA